MQSEDENQRFQFGLHNISLETTPKRDHSIKSSRRDLMSRSQDCNTDGIHIKLQNTPEKYQETPQSSSSSYKKDIKIQSNDNKRKMQQCLNESPGKIRKTQSGTYVYSLINQWCKRTGITAPLSKTDMVHISQLENKTPEKYVTEDRKVAILQKKLESAQETISSLSLSRNDELEAKEEIKAKLNETWESIEIINTYYNDISESFIVFQQHHTHLSTLLNKVETVQQSKLRNLQEDLDKMKKMDDEQKKYISEAEAKVLNQEKRVQELIIKEAELQKQLNIQENRFISEKNNMESIFAEEKFKLIKEQEEILSRNEMLQSQLKQVENDQQSTLEVVVQKDAEIKQLQEKISEYNNKIEELSRLNSEFTIKCNKSSEKEEELTKDLQLKVEQIRRLNENLSARQKIETELTKDINTIENNFANQREQYKNLQTDLVAVKKQLKEEQARNRDLLILVEEMKNSNEYKISDLNKKIITLEKENETMSEKIVKDQSEFKIKLAEKTKRMAVECTDASRLNENLNEKSQNFRGKLRPKQEAKKKLESKLNDKPVQITEYDTKQTEKTVETRFSASQQNIQLTQEKLASSEAVQLLRHKDVPMHMEQDDIYNFNIAKVSEDAKKISSPLLSPKRFSSNLKSPTQIPANNENLSYLSQHWSKSQSNPAPEVYDQDTGKVSEDKNSPFGKKFFKSRGATVKKYDGWRAQNKK